jgi:hypothetical protein
METQCVFCEVRLESLKYYLKRKWPQDFDFLIYCEFIILKRILMAYSLDEFK